MSVPLRKLILYLSNMIKEKYINVRITEDKKELLKSELKSNGMTISSFLTLSIENYLKSIKN